MHSNSPSACLVIFGCNKNSVHIIDIMMFRFNPVNTLGKAKYSITQISTSMIIKIIGKKMVKKALKISLDGVNIFISVSSTNQSNDKNASDEDPTISIDPNISIKPSGNFKLNEYAAVTSCK